VEVFIDPDDHRSLVDQVYAHVRAAIVEGRLEPGDVLTPSRTLADQLGISRFTVTEAYARLVAEGFAEGRGRGGTVVTSRIRAAVPPQRRGQGVHPRPAVETMSSFADPAVPPSTRFDLRAGQVDPALFPLRVWRRCTSAVLRSPPPDYGDPAGDEALRRALARWIGRTRGVVCDPAEVVVTSGALHGLDLVARAVLEPGHVVAVEEPGYPPAVDLLRTNGYCVHGVPVDEHGIVVDAIPEEARLVYVTPSHQFPLGAVLTDERRLALLHWARDHDATIVEDDYDSHIRFASRPLEPLHRLDTDGRVVYVGTFSKVLSPALRLGFAVAPPSLADALADIRSTVDWCPPWPNQGALARFIEDGHLDRHIVKATRQYRRRRDRIVERLADAPPSVRVLPAPAGLHVTLVFDEDGAPEDREIRAATRAERIVVGSLRRCYSFRPPRAGMLVGFGAVPDDQVDAMLDAVQRVLICLTDGTGRH